MKDSIKSLINKIPNEYSIIKKLALKFLDEKSMVTEEGTINVFHRPWIAPLNWGIMLYQGIQKDKMSKFNSMTDKNIPEFYLDFLTIINGFYIHDMGLFGLSPSIFGEKKLNRKNLEQLDLSRANISWNREFKVEESFFYFGGRSYSNTENLGYFVDGNNEIFSMLKNGEIISTWNNFDQFLNEEIELVEKKMIDEIKKA